MSSSRFAHTTRPPRWRQADTACAAVLSVAILLTGPSLRAQEVEASTDALLSAKLDAYVDCINFHGNWTLQSRDRYFSWLKSPEKGPTGREDIVYGLYELRDPADCRARIEASAKLDPDDAELEAAADAFIDALESARDVVGEAYTYYELGNWQDDGMRQGKALHPRLVAAFAAFAAADTSLRDRVSGLQTEMAERRLARLAEDPDRRDVYIVERLAFDAERMLDHLDDIGAKSFPRERFEAAVTTFESAWQEYDKFAKANPKHPNGAIGDALLAHHAFDLLKSAKSTMRRERQGFRFDEGERMLIEAQAAQMVDGHPSQLVDKYNQFVDSINRARR